MPDQPETEQNKKDGPVLLRLMALDEADLEVISAHCQDAVMRLDDMAYLPNEQRFAMVLNRFDWESAHEGQQTSHKDRKHYQRRRAALRFECVKKAKVHNLDLAKKANVVKLLSINFQVTTPPSGDIYLIFSGGSEIKLEVECIESALKDLGAVWQTPSRPDHKLKGS